MYFYLGSSSNYWECSVFTCPIQEVTRSAIQSSHIISFKVSLLYTQITINNPTKSKILYIKCMEKNF